MSILLNPYSVAPSGPPAGPLAYKASATDSVDRTVYTFSAVNIGGADPNRIVVVGLSVAYSTGRSIASITIGGVAATVIAARVGNPLASINTITTVLCEAVVPSGTTADVVVTMSGTCQGMAIAVWAGLVVSATPRDVGSTVAGSLPINNLDAIVGSKIIYFQGVTSDGALTGATSFGVQAMTVQATGTDGSPSSLIFRACDVISSVTSSSTSVGNALPNAGSGHNAVGGSWDLP